MSWLKKWLTPAPVAPTHRCRFRRLTSGWAKKKLVYKCQCGAMYGVGQNGWRHVRQFDPAKSKY